MLSFSDSIVDLENFDSINQNHQVDTVSNKYSFIPTTRVINTLASLNWYPVRAEQVNVRKEAHQGYQKHLIRFRNDSISMIQGENFPEIVLTNSHNGLASFCIMAGIFRLVCSNGLIVANSTFASHKIKHMGYTDNKVKLAVDNVVENIPKIAGKVNQYQEIELTPDEQGIYALAALTVKYGEQALQEREFDVNRLLRPYRYEDNKPTLWHTYNNIQEKFINGGKFEINKEKQWKRKKTRVTKNINENVRVNQALWLLTEKMAELKSNAIPLHNSNIHIN
jgi:hypothetical protein